MSGAQADGAAGPPALARDARGRVVPSSLADVIQWFLDYDERVVVVRYPAVEALFQSKQQAETREQPEAVTFARAEDRRARPVVVIETLRQLGILDAEALAALAPYASFVIRNHRGDEVGEVRASFQLERIS